MQAPHPRPTLVIRHFIKLMVMNMMHLNMPRKFKILGQKISLYELFILIFTSYDIVPVSFCSKQHECKCDILYNRSINKKLILCYILDTILSVLVTYSHGQN